MKTLDAQLLEDSREVYKSQKLSSDVMAATTTIRDLREVYEDHENGLIFEKNISIPLKNSELPVRCNVYRPIGDGKFPVLVTYGPYGKDIPYAT